MNPESILVNLPACRATTTPIATNVYRFVFALPTATDVLGLPIGQHVAIRAVVDAHRALRSAELDFVAHGQAGQIFPTQ
jgi:hypothetical protein